MSAKAALDRYAVIGHPVAHSHSPRIHQWFAEQTGQQLTYELIDADETEFEQAVLDFRGAGGKGLNVTVPHKERAFHLAQRQSREARAARAANTLELLDELIVAHNTDGIGFIRDLTQNLGLDIAGRKVLVLGAGGATRGIVGPLLAAGAVLTVANRTMARAIELHSLLSPLGEFAICSFEALPALPDQDIIVNATSAGVKGEGAPFPDAIFSTGSFCYDLSYSVEETAFQHMALAAGARRAVQGWGMLVEQAAESFFIWRGIRPDTVGLLEQLAH